MIDDIHKTYHPWKKPRDYRRIARKDYLALAKAKKCPAKKVRATVRKMLGYVCREQEEGYMKVHNKSLVMVLLSFAIILSVLPVSNKTVYAASIKTLFKTKTVYSDITGNNKKDSIRFELSGIEENYNYGKVSVYVNGKKLRGFVYNRG